MPRESEQNSYLGLNSTSTDLWRKFLHYYENDFTAYDYNVHVGQGIASPPYFTQEEKALWKTLTQKRIDVIAERFDETWIFEIDERPVSRTVGQIFVYGTLAAKYLQLKPVVRAALICARLGHDMAEVFKAQGVLVFLFPPAGAPSFPPAFMPTGVAAPPPAQFPAA